MNKCIECGAEARNKKSFLCDSCFKKILREKE
ncbi:hypothetical protein [Virgibacillus phage Mimir87]|nr:hypothetical protein [Virgibacillus phage Mimir87]